MRFTKRYSVLIVFVVLTMVGLMIRYGVGIESWLWDFWGIIDVSFAVALGVLAFLGYRELISSEDEISIIFKVENEEIDTGLRLLRKDCTRSEINGILTMPLKDEIHFHTLAYMKDSRLLISLNNIQKGKDREFIIPINSKELEQFNL